MNTLNPEVRQALRSAGLTDAAIDRFVAAEDAAERNRVEDRASAAPVRGKARAMVANMSTRAPLPVYARLAAIAAKVWA